MKCPTCGGAMRPLFTSWFCPKDCDKEEDTNPGFRHVHGLRTPPSDPKTCSHPALYTFGGLTWCWACGAHVA